MNKPLTMNTAEPFYIPGGKTGVLLIHGYTGTPFEMRMLADSLAMDGYTILTPRLFAHATDPLDMNRARWKDWIASVEDGINLLKGSTDGLFVMGLSMGGILSLIAAARFNFMGVVSISTPIDLPEDPRSKFLPLLAHLKIKISKGEPDWRNPEAGKDHVDYPYYPVRSILELQKLIGVMRNELVDVKIPALLVQSHQDRSIPANSMDYLYENISSVDKIRMWVENSGHVVIREPEREKVFAAAKSFIKRILTTG